MTLGSGLILKTQFSDWIQQVTILYGAPTMERMHTFLDKIKKIVQLCETCDLIIWTLN